MGNTVSYRYNAQMLLSEMTDSAGEKTEYAYDGFGRIREVKDGIGERAAFEHFGERCGLRPYRKLSSLIVQNLRKGSKGLTSLMEAEADEAFELRKNLAKKLGEEAGTKQLSPVLYDLSQMRVDMAVVLAVVFVV